MKESFGATQLFIIVITLILLFSGIMALTINHANAFAVKDQLVQIIEKHGGFNPSNASFTNEEIKGSDPNDVEALKEMVESLQSNSYRQNGKCPSGAYAYQRNGKREYGNKADFCIVKTETNSGATAYYYKVIVFYNLDIPVLREAFNLRSIGETKKLYR